MQLERRSASGKIRHLYNIHPTKMLEIVVSTQEGRYFTSKDLRDGLAKFRGKSVPRSTLHDWLNLLGIEPDETGCYSPENFTLLARYAVWLQRGGLSKGFLAINNIQSKEKSSNDQQQRQGIRNKDTASADTAPAGTNVNTGTPDVICI